jgi:transcriptional regulator with XRE-family HTH domain
MSRLRDLLNEVNRDEALAAEDAAATNVVAQLVQARALQGITQAEVGKRAGLTQAVVARIEGFESDVRLSTLVKYALAVGAQIQVKPPKTGHKAKPETRGRPRGNFSHTVAASPPK